MHTESHLSQWEKSNQQEDKSWSIVMCPNRGRPKCLNKSTALKKFKEWEAAITNQTDCKNKTLRAGNGVEYTSTNFEDFLKEKGICNGPPCHIHSRKMAQLIAERMKRSISTILHSRLHKVSGWKQFASQSV